MTILDGSFASRWLYTRAIDDVTPATHPQSESLGEDSDYDNQSEHRSLLRKTPMGGMTISDGSFASPLLYTRALNDGPLMAE
jgi:hypothetical protein